MLHSVADLLGRQVTLDRLLAAMVEVAVRAVDAERGTLYLLDSRDGRLRSLVAQLPELEQIVLEPGQGVAGQVASRGKPLRVPDAAGDEHFFPGIDERTGFRTRSLLAVPVRDGKEAVLGVLQVLNHRSGEFTEQHQQLLEQLAGQVAVVLSHTSFRPAPGARAGLNLAGPFNRIIGSSPPMQELYRRLLSACQTDVSVLLRGETGTGKNLVARAIHDNSARSSGPLVIVDCTTLPAGLMESELFGHERGAFTGAQRRVAGKCELADGGTLVLDEVGDLPLPLQGKLLGFLQEHRFERLGGRRSIVADVRIVSATNADLEQLVSRGDFRRDLYYRLKVLELEIPPLRRRGADDVRLLAEHFLAVFAERHRRPARRFAARALRLLQEHDWPGNVRELEHCVESAVVLCPGRQVEAEHLSLPGVSGGDSGTVAAGYPPGTPLRQVERDHIRRTLEACAGNRSEAARRLGIGRNTLARKLQD